MRLPGLLSVVGLVLSTLAVSSLAQDDLSSYDKTLTVGSSEYPTLGAALGALSKFTTEKVRINLPRGDIRERAIVDYKGKVALVGIEDYMGKTANLKYDASKDPNNPRKTDADATTLIIRGGAEVLIQDLTIVNEIPAGKAPAPALFVDVGSSVTVRSSLITSNSNAIFVSSGARVHITNTTWVNGASDILYGAGTLIFENGNLKSLAAGAFVAWKGGHGFQGSVPGCFVLDSSTEGEPASIGKVFLGRPLDHKATIVWARDHIHATLAPSIWSVPTRDPRISGQTQLYEVSVDGRGIEGAERKFGEVRPASESSKYSFALLWGQK